MKHKQLSISWAEISAQVVFISCAASYVVSVVVICGLPAAVQMSLIILSECNQLCQLCFSRAQQSVRRALNEEMVSRSCLCCSDSNCSETSSRGGFFVFFPPQFWRICYTQGAFLGWLRKTLCFSSCSGIRFICWFSHLQSRITSAQ